MHIHIGEGIRSVLLVEDEGLVAMVMEEMLKEMGVSEIHYCPDAQSALEIAKTTDIDCAVLDLWARDGNTIEVADALAERGVPFIFSTGSDMRALEERHRHRPLIAKPFADDDFKVAVLDACTLGRSQRRSATVQ